MSNLEDDDQDEGLELPRPATFGERLAAFLVDGLLFYGLFTLTLKLVYSDTPVLLNPAGRPWLAVWAVLFVLYHAEAAAAGRPTAGKWLLGLRVVGQDGQPLPFPRSLIRAAGYFPSSALNLGFLWALVDEQGRTWHDMLSNSKVITVRPWPRAAVLAADLACFAFLFGTFAWQQFGAPEFYGLETIANSKRALETLATLEDVYHTRNGRYTENVDRLVQMTPEPGLYYQALAMVVSPEKGIRIRVQPDGKAFTVLAYSNDRHRTQIKFKGPLTKTI